MFFQDKPFYYAFESDLEHPNLSVITSQVTQERTRFSLLLDSADVHAWLRTKAAPHFIQREQDPSEKTGQGFLNNCREKENFCHHRSLKRLSNFTAHLLITPATDTEKSYRSVRGIDTMEEKN